MGATILGACVLAVAGAIIFTFVGGKPKEMVDKLVSKLKGSTEGESNG